MAKNLFLFPLAFLLFFSAFSSTSASTTSPAKIVSGVFSNAVSVLMKYLWSLKATTKTAISSRPLMKFESGYTVETVFDGSKLGVEPYSVEVLPSGDLLVLDSANSNLYKISSSLSLHSRPKRIAGSAEGYSGHVDGRLREAKMNHPTGLTVDDRGHIYVADTANNAIRKISDTGVSTIAGGKVGRGGGGHVDGPSEDAKFSNDFDVIYIGSSCSLLVIDRGNQAIREIQLNYDDCAYQYGNAFPLGIAVLAAAGFFGYMLALLQRRVGSIVSSQDDLRSMKTSIPPPYQKHEKSSVWPPLIPTEDEQEKQEESFFGSLAKLLENTGAVATEILGSVFPGLRKKQHLNNNNYQYNNMHGYPQNQKYSNPWPVQDSFVIQDEDEPPPPSIETRTPTPRKTYPFMTKDVEKMQQFCQSRNFYAGWEGEFQQSQQPTQRHQNNGLWEGEYSVLQQQQQKKMQRQQHHHRHYSSAAETRYEQSDEKTNEIVFGAVQEKDESVVIKALDHGDSLYDRRRIRSRSNPRGYVNGN